MPRSTRCAAVLAQPLPPQVCQSFREARRFAMCRAWELLDGGEARSFREAVRRSWREFQAQCRGQEGR